MDDAHRLIERLHRGGQANYWWRLRDKKSAWYTGAPNVLPTTADTYFNVHPCAAIPDRGDPCHVRGKLEDVAAINCLPAEYDAKDFGDDMTAILEHIEQLPMPPTVIVNSGHGYHAYWILAEPLLLDDNGTRESAARTQAAWVQFVGGDPGAKDLARVLRVPGTTNAKREPAMAVEILNYTDDEYTLDELEALLPAQQADTPMGGSQAAGTGNVIQDNLGRAFKALRMLGAERVDDYEAWLEVGMSLRELGRLGLELWDEWSTASDKYKPGACSAKWETFSEGDRADLTLASLYYWAEQDAGTKAIEDCPPHARPSHYIAALGTMGYTFALNLMNDDVHVCGARQDDVIRAVLFTELREHGYNNPRVAEDAWIAEASKHRFHPIRDYLNSQTWDGQDHIAKLCGYVDEGSNTGFNTFLRRFLIGAIARPMAGPTGVQARAFVIDGPQGIGKSRLVRFLGSPLPQFYMESGINTEDKDFLLYLCSTWIWEVAELGSTMRKADRDALKHFISRQTVTVRRAYGRNDTRKPAIAALIPTINNEAGFLWDPTGYRRFMVASIERIDWDYERLVDVNQLWAQATALYRAGEAWELTHEEHLAAEDIAQEYEVSDPLVDYILAEYEIDPRQALPGMDDWFTPTAAILSRLKGQNYIREAGRREAMQVGGILLKLGCRRGRLRQADGQRPKGHFGVRIRI